MNSRIRDLTPSVRAAMGDVLESMAFLSVDCCRAPQSLPHGDWISATVRNVSMPGEQVTVAAPGASCRLAASAAFGLDPDAIDGQILRDWMGEFANVLAGRCLHATPWSEQGILSMPELAEGVVGGLESYSWFTTEDGALFALRIEEQIATLQERVQLLETSNRQLLKALEQCSDVIFMTDLDGRIVWVNQTFERVYGWPIDEVLGKTPRILKSNMHPPETYAGFWKHIRSGQAFRGVFVNLRRDGEPVHVEVTIDPIHGSDGAPAGYLAYQRDVTERVGAQARSRMLAAAMESTSFGILVFDADWSCVYANKGARGMVGDPDAGADAVLTALGVQDPPGFRSVIEENGEAEGWTGRLTRNAPGQRRQVLDVVASQVRGEEGALAGFVFALRDITRELELESRLAQAGKMASIGVLAGGIAHDFNNTLTPILGYAEMALGREDGAREFEEHFLVIKDSAEKAQSMVRQLLAFSRKQEVELRRMDFGRLIVGSERLVRRLLRENLRLEVAAPAHPSWVLADPSQIHQIILNFAANAQDAMPHGGTFSLVVQDVPQIELCPDSVLAPMARGPYTRLDALDTGTGIPEAILPRLFDPFFTTKEPGKGTGLGLATVFGIVKQHSGYIWARNRPEGGACFSVYLPAVGAPEPQAPVVQNSVLRTAHRARPGEVVLVVEDDSRVRQLVVDMLFGQGFQVLAAADGESAIARFGQVDTRIDLLLCDVLLPGMNGRLLHQALQRNHPRLPVVFVSGYSRQQLPEPTEDAFEAFFTKPFSLEKILPRIREMIDARRERGVRAGRANPSGDAPSSVAGEAIGEGSRGPVD